MNLFKIPEPQITGSCEPVLRNYNFPTFAQFFSFTEHQLCALREREQRIERHCVSPSTAVIITFAYNIVSANLIYNNIVDISRKPYIWCVLLTSLAEIYTIMGILTQMLQKCESGMQLLLINVNVDLCHISTFRIWSCKNLNFNISTSKDFNFIVCV